MYNFFKLQLVAIAVIVMVGAAWTELSHVAGNIDSSVRFLSLLCTLLQKEASLIIVTENLQIESNLGSFPLYPPPQLSG